MLSPLESNKQDFRGYYGLGHTYEILRMPCFALYYYKQAHKLRSVQPRIQASVWNPAWSGMGLESCLVRHGPGIRPGQAWVWNPAWSGISLESGLARHRSGIRPGQAWVWNPAWSGISLESGLARHGSGIWPGQAWAWNPSHCKARQYPDIGSDSRHWFPALVGI